MHAACSATVHMHKPPVQRGAVLVIVKGTINYLSTMLGKPGNFHSTTRLNHLPYVRTTPAHLEPTITDCWWYAGAGPRGNNQQSPDRVKLLSCLSR